MGVSWMTSVEIEFAKRVNYQVKIQKFLSFFETYYEKVSEEQYISKELYYSDIWNFRQSYNKVYWNSQGYGRYDDFLEQVSGEFKGEFAQLFKGCNSSTLYQYGYEVYIDGERSSTGYKYLDNSRRCSDEFLFKLNVSDLDLIVESVSCIKKYSKCFPNLSRLIVQTKEKGYKFPTYQQLCKKLGVGSMYLGCTLSEVNEQTKVIAYELISRELSNYMQELDDNKNDSLTYDFETLAIMQLKNLAWNQYKFRFDDIE